MYNWKVCVSRISFLKMIVLVNWEDNKMIERRLWIEDVRWNEW